MTDKEYYTNIPDIAPAYGGGMRTVMVKREEKMSNE